jgi:heptosyltransferase-1
MRLLIVKLSALGDVVHALPALRFLRAVVPGVHVTWVVERRVAGILDGQGIDAVVAIDTRALRDDLRRGRVGTVVAEVRRVRRLLRAPGFDVAVDLQGNIKSGVVIAQARALRKVGLPRRLCREAQNTWFTGEQADVVGTHVVDLSGEVVAHALGARWQVPDGAALHVEAGAAAAVAARLGDHPGPRIAFINGASWWTKQWSVASFVALGRHLIEECHAQIVLPWGDEGERRRAAEIAVALGPAAMVSERGSLAALAALLAACDVVVGGDTGPVHMAWAVGTPTVSLYGPNPSARNGPRGPRHRVFQSTVECSPCWGKECPTGEFICMDSIFVGQVAEAVEALLA